MIKPSDEIDTIRNSQKKLKMFTDKWNAVAKNRKQE